jgi:hypothetical protein
MYSTIANVSVNYAPSNTRIFSLSMEAYSPIACMPNGEEVRHLLAGF